MIRPHSSLGRVAVAALVCLAVGASSGAERQDDDEPSARGFVRMFGGYVADYDPAATPADLAQRSDLVVEGAITNVTSGPAVDDPGAIRSVILNVSVSAVHEGKPPEGSDGVVYIELPSPGSKPADAYADALPPDLPGVFYLVEAAADVSEILDPGSGRPDGQPLFWMTTPQGLVVAGDEAVLTVVNGEELKGADLTEFLPDSAGFPG